MEFTFVKSSMQKLLIIGVGLTTSCTDLVVPELADNGYFKTSYVLRDDNVEVQAAFKEHYRRLLYVSADPSGTHIINTDFSYMDLYRFFVDSLRQTNTFDRVMDKEQMEGRVLAESLSDSVPNVSDKIGWHELAQRIGPFLVVVPYVEANGEVCLKAFDPMSGKEVLSIKRTLILTMGYDQPVLYPLLNGFLDWSRGDKIKTQSR